MFRRTWFGAVAAAVGGLLYKVKPVRRTIFVVDMNGVEIKPGARVVVHQDEGDSFATVDDVFPDAPTVKKRGHWVDIEKDAHEGLEGMMSYILEVTAA